MFRLKDMRSYTVSELYIFKAKVLLSQGIGNMFSQKLENRIQKIDFELQKRTK